MRNLIVLSILLILPGWIYRQPAECEDCARTATRAECISKDPMGILAPAAYCPSVNGHLAELLTKDCFHFLASPDYSKSLRDDGLLPNYGSKARIPEYSFEADFISGILEHDNDGFAVRSKLTIKMFFNGDQRELVHSWQTLGTQEKDPVSLNEPNRGTSWSGHMNKLEHEYKNGPDIVEITKRFEKRPSECNIDPEKDEVAEGESIEVKITDFKDESGQTSREFNRIVVHADHGKIRNGESCETGPEYKVFKVGDGNITVQYQGPQNCENDKDKITVYNSCEILPESKVSFRSTKQKEKISEKEITVKCYDAVLTITKTLHHEIRTSKSEKKPVAGCTAETREHHDLLDDVEATITVTLKAEIMADMPVLTDQRWVSYKPLKSEITVFRMNYDETEHKYHNTSGGDCESASGFESNLTRRREIINKPAIAGIIGPDFKVAFDIKTNKALKFMGGMCALMYGFNQNESVDARKWPKDDPKLSYSRDDKIEKYLFILDPVEDQVKDPYGRLNPSGIREYMKGKVSEEVLANIPDLPIDEESKNSAKIHPDLLVKTGDGINEFGGEGYKEIIKPLKDGTEKEELHYKWNIKLTEK